MGAQQNADGVREMCTRAGLGDGARLVDIGCGPIGALAELAEIAGPTGSVVGVDSSAEAVNSARAGTGTGQVRIQRGGVQLRRVQHVGHVSAVVVVGEQRALNILGAAPWARRNPAGSRQRIVWVEGFAARRGEDHPVSARYWPGVRYRFGDTWREPVRG